MRKLKTFYIISLVVVLIDQVTKLLVYHFMDLGIDGEIPILGKWLRIHYTLNPNMAFGLKLGFKYGKLFLTTFRIFATYVIASFIPKLVPNKKISFFVLFGWALILGGAIGNVIDGIFYGILLDNAPPTAPMKLFHGQVIDMILVGIENIWIPSFIPIIGGRYLPPFPVFNIADSAISCGVIAIILDNIYSSYFSRKPKKERAKLEDVIPE